MDVRRLTIKLSLCLVYLVIITILFVCAYKLFQQKKSVDAWSDVKNKDQYSYIEVSRMSEKFAYYENENVGLHFVVEEKETGEWNTYVVAINEKNYDKYKELINYSYGRSEEEPAKIKIYGYPTIMNTTLKRIVINNINNFLPEEKRVDINLDNIDSYITNCYLDTTAKRAENFDVLLFITLLLILVMFIILILTILDRSAIMNSVDEMLPGKDL